ncbi:MAG: substrate-binding domain-containing protein [Paracoccaceae bacterium]|nr:substrate-binding domain-containing protein [Paracoccaceae bacterium]
MRFCFALALVLCAVPGVATERTLTLASTTSTQNSGLYDYLLPILKDETGIDVQVVAVGTGQALRIAQNGDADAVMVHHRTSEDAFVSGGHGVDRRDVMYNDFVIVGPAVDPAGISLATSVRDAFEKLAEGQVIFISRGDDSGTHKREQEFWEMADVEPSGSWYREIGSGMGAALNMASVTDGYTLSDRGTWLSFGNKGNLTILFSADPPLFNPYGLILVNPDRHDHVRHNTALQFADWLTSVRGQLAIAGFRVAGEQLFCPNSEEFLSLPQDQRPPCPD